MTPQTDLFATPHNTKCFTFVVPYPTSHTALVNALVVDWKSLRTPLYAFPPPDLIHRVLYRWRTSGQPPLLLVVPDWKEKSWMAVSMCDFRLSMTSPGLSESQTCRCIAVML